MNNPMIPVCLPQLPLAENIYPYLQQVDKNRWYTNYGPLAKEFMSRMAELFQLKRSQVITCSNGTVMLELCLKALDIPKDSLCIMPSWTFVATPLSAINANLKPYFVDIDLDTQTILPEKLEQEISEIKQYGEIGAVIAVTPFGLPVNVKAWDNFTERTGIPVIIDAAAGFDTVLQLSEMKPSKTPMMISLHATKVLGVGEAAILFSHDENLVNQIECLTQFGFPKGIRNAESFGTNAKISEYVAAVGLAALDIWPETRNQWESVSQCYQHYFKHFDIQHTLHSEWVPSTCNVFLSNQADHAVLDFDKHNIMTRKWYGDGCHKHTVLKNSLSANLENTEYLADSLLGLPFYIGLSEIEIARIIGILEQQFEKKVNKKYAT